MSHLNARGAQGNVEPTRTNTLPRGARARSLHPLFLFDLI